MFVSRLPPPRIVNSAGPPKKPARQPEAVAAGIEGQRNPRDLVTGPDRLIRQPCSTASSRSGLGSSFLRG
jgi:hypothetical protein